MTRPPAALVRKLKRYPELLYEDVMAALSLFSRNRGASSLGPPAITSWYRTIAYNASVGGDPDSQHLIGFAVDVFPRVPASIANYLRLRETVIVEGDHTHIQLFPRGRVTWLVRDLRR